MFHSYVSLPEGMFDVLASIVNSYTYSVYLFFVHLCTTFVMFYWSYTHHTTIPDHTWWLYPLKAPPW
jgi:hypothetical protein